MSQPQPSLAIRIEDVVKFPPPGLAIPTAVEFAPDGTHVTFLWSPEGTLTRQLFVHNWQTEETRELFSPPDGGATEDNLSPEEKLRRERLRERGLGITRYRWAEDGERFIVPLLGEVWVQDRLRGAPHQVVDSDHEPAIDPRLSRDGRFIAYVHDAELYVVQAEGGTARQLTDGARGTGKTHGLAEYIAQEEMGRQEGFWWSYDGELLAFTEVDETHIPAYRIVHQGRDTPGHEDHSYPFAGQPNAKVRLGVVPRRGGRVTWMDLQMDGEDPADLYLARVHWMPDGALLAEVENRAQSRLDLLALDPKTGRRSVVLTERSDVWINLHHLFHPLESGAGGFVLGSERSGFMHLYLYDRRGALVRPLTEGSWQVDALEGVDEANGWVYFTATRDGATQRHLYRVALAGGPIVKLTTSPGMHSIVMDRAHERFIDTVSSIDQPPTITIRRASDGEALGEIPISGDPRIAALQLRPPELVTLATRDGVELHGALYRPRSEPPYPVVVSVYGGPQAQRVQNAWTLTADMSAQYLRELGFAVWKLDNRGSARRGLAFEGAIRHNLGNLEIADQVDGIRWLQDQGLVDGDRVGIYGWSYGGYMAALALARAPGVFKVAVAGAPVSHWDGYDTHYTERYMGTPQGNPEGYRTSSVIAQAETITGKLMLVHGLIDENVHFRHTARLVNALVAAGKDYELLLFPDERHMLRRDADRVYMERRIVDFFRHNL